MKPVHLVVTAAIALTGALSACTSPGAAPDGAATSASIEKSCINPTRIRDQKVVSDQEIRFTLNDGEVWINHLPRVCPGLKFQQGFSWEVRGMLVCSNEQTIKVKDEGTSCELGEFTKAPPEPKT